MRTRNIMARLSYLLTLLLLMAACQHSDLQNPVVARVGDAEIRFDEFIADFVLHPEFRSNSSLADARQQHLRHMRDRLLLAEAAHIDGLDTTAILTGRLQYIRHREMLKALYRQDILNTIPVSEEAAFAEYKRSLIQVRVRHLFARSETDAAAFLQRLDNGESFEAIARGVFRDSLLAANGGDLGFLGINELDPLLVDSVYNLRVGVPSRPLRSTHGWHIFRVDDIRQEVFLSKEQFEQTRSNHEGSIRMRRAFAKSREYLAAVLRGKSVDIKGKVVEEMLLIHQKVLTVRPNEYPGLAPKVTDRELHSIFGASSDLYEQVLVEFAGRRWTVADFLEKLKVMPPLHRPAIGTPEQLIQAVIDLARDDLLLEKAYERGLQNDPQVIADSDVEERRMLSAEFQKRLQFVYFQQQDSLRWAQRREVLAALREQKKLVVDTTALYSDLTESQRRAKTPLIRMVLKDNYDW